MTFSLALAPGTEQVLLSSAAGSLSYAARFSAAEFPYAFDFTCVLKIKRQILQRPTMMGP